MIVRSLDSEHLTPAYGALFQQIYPHSGEDAAEWGVGRAVVKPFGSTDAHAHPDHEIFIILAGVGKMIIADEPRTVTAGQAILIPAGSRHLISNPDPVADLVFINVYWPVSLGAIDL